MESSFYQYLKRSPKLKLWSKLKVFIWLVTAVIFTLVGLMNSYKFTNLGVDFSFMPPVIACLNSFVAFSLIMAVMAIKKQNIKQHKRFISMAMAASALFLICYVAYHFTTDETRYGGQGLDRRLYFIFLISHIVLAAVSLPFIFYTWAYGFTNQFKKHRKLARIIFPIWLYVAISGVICYIMLRPYY